MTSIQYLKYFLYLLVLLMNPFCVFAQNLVIDSLAPSYNLTPYLEFAADPTGIITIKDLFDPKFSKNFKPYSPLQNLDSKTTYWTKVRIDNHLNNVALIKNWKLFVGKADYINVFLTNEQGQILEHQKTGSLYPASEKKLKKGNNINRVDISLISDQIQYLFVQYTRINGHKINIAQKLRNKDFYEEEVYKVEMYKRWFLIGFIFTMLFINVSFFIGIKDKSYLFHALFILASLLFLSDYYGVLADTIYIKDHPLLIGHIDYFSISLLIISFVLFIRYYLDSERLGLFGIRFFNGLVLFQILSFILVEILYYLLHNEPLTDKIIACSIIIVFFFVHRFLFIKYKFNDTRGYFLLSGSVLIFMAILLNSFSIFQGKGLWNQTTELLLPAEILIFSLGLGFRMKELYQQKLKLGKLMVLDSIKNTFYSNISHEFRTPLTVIAGTSELLRGNNKIENLDQITDGLKIIEKNADELLKLVNQILDLSKLESDHLSVNYQNHDLIKLVLSITASLQYYADKKNIEIQTDSFTNELMMDIDIDKLQSILSNLISNAIKYSEKNTKIKVRVTLKMMTHKEFVEINVSDQGIGINEIHLEHIFDRYFSIDTKVSDSIPGTGIGLALTKELVTLLNGTISVESEVGKGSQFFVILPVNRKTSIASDVENYPPSQELKSDLKMNIDSEKDELESPILLIIDDSEDILNYLVSLLKSDYKILKAHDGDEGYRVAMEELPDLIISDVMMPIKNGITLCRELKNHELTNHIPIILLTAKAEIDDKLEGLTSGADEYLVKPFNQKELMIRLKNLNELRKMLKEKFINKLEDVSFIPDSKVYGLIKKIDNIIEINLNNEQFGVESLAELLFISRMQLHRKLKAIADKSTSHYIRSYRLKKSKPLLMDNSISISEVAYDVGFQDPNYFSKSFYKEFGITPSEFRNS